MSPKPRIAAALPKSRKRRVTASSSSNDESDIVWGVSSIAPEINRSANQVYYLISQGKLPVKRHGHKTYSASRERLRAWCVGDFPDAVSNSAA
jgi:hypothetical protein